MSKQQDVEQTPDLTDLSRFKRKRSPCAEFVRGLVFIFCGFLFACQTTLLVSHYFSYPTTIVTKLNRTNIVTIPAISLCFPFDGHNLQALNANELFKKNFVEGIKSSISIKCRLLMPTLTKNSFRETRSPIHCADVSPVVQSINYGQSQKCFTYFSRMSRTMEESEFQVRKDQTQSIHGAFGDLVSIEIDFPESVNDQFYEDREATLIIHQANELPNFNQKLSKIKPGQDYIISFSKITEKRMQPPFRPGCKAYNSRVRDAESKYYISSRRECVNSCIIRLYREYCQCLPSNLNIHRDLIYSSDAFCGEVQCSSLSDEDTEKCRRLSRCYPSCVEDSYEFITEASSSATAPNYGPNFGNRKPGLSDIANALTKTYIIVRKSSMPDVLYEHQPHLEYIEFVFQVLTLACVWLGISVFALIWKPLYLIGKLFNKLWCWPKKQTVPMIDIMS
ncbi:Amiloride-sensitive cation channel 5-like protein [Dinothrombium tinctorium]|uniref:Amiloride-sensitive cation channel 5-like protein n=1 Tax=Dinothrombium tinctorium TaxID=1965070 RepID=A0A3S3SFB1_9ACAR|nr:Amiloride-sensitive cation channel 5-like protein [Dinothrombium tinctorium]